MIEFTRHDIQQMVANLMETSLLDYKTVFDRDH